MDFLLRPYRAADFERLWQIDQACFPPGIAYSQMELSGFITRRNAITIVAEFANQAERQVDRSDANSLPVRAEQNRRNSENAAGKAHNSSTESGANTIAGFAVAQSRHKTGRLLTLDVVPEAQRYGLGSRLLQECEERLRKRGCTEVYLETAVNNEPALKLYHKMGYHILRTLPAYYHATGLDAFLMGKVL